ncbi:PREDICTED: diuretic hormone 1-like isoform X2 [Papilio polytes]|uniref:diuretic hormone 1-like isoform X2 n=1 Tax=Papilio polytes TaxID=76194 RepID=UPI000675DFB9|nr:PREDICTED: diuretic hormone 1-like isoform X2 [Papilio polytes]
MMWWAVWCVAVAGAGALAAAAPSDGLVPISTADWEQIDASTTDDENVGNAVAPMGGRYAAAAPWVYLLADMPKDSQSVKVKVDAKRSRSSISVYPALEVLQRGAYNNYMERLAHANRNFLNCVGKRDPMNSADCRLKH